MVNEEQIKAWVEEAIAASDLFLIRINFQAGQRIGVSVDGDQGVTIADCVRINRHLEKSLEASGADLEVNVSSPGVGEPLEVHRQYVNNQGRQVKVETLSGDVIKGELRAVEEEAFVVHTRSREKVEGKKGRQWVETDHRLPFNEVKSTKIQVAFK